MKKLFLLAALVSMMPLNGMDKLKKGGKQSHTLLKNDKSDSQPIESLKPFYGEKWDQAYIAWNEERNCYIICAIHISYLGSSRIETLRIWDLDGKLIKQHNCNTKKSSPSFQFTDDALYFTVRDPDDEIIKLSLNDGRKTVFPLQNREKMLFSASKAGVVIQGGDTFNYYIAHIDEKGQSDKAAVKTIRTNKIAILDSGDIFAWGHAGHAMSPTEFHGIEWGKEDTVKLFDLRHRTLEALLKNKAADNKIIGCYKHKVLDRTIVCTIDTDNVENPMADLFHVDRDIAGWSMEQGRMALSSSHGKKIYLFDMTTQRKIMEIDQGAVDDLRLDKKEPYLYYATSDQKPMLTSLDLREKLK